MMASGMDAFILSGGLGIRLRSVVGDGPKVMGGIAGKPFLEYVILQLKRYGVRRIVLCVGYQAETIQEYFGRGERLGVQLGYSVESEPLGTAGALKLAAPLIESTEVLVLNGDSFFDLNLERLLEYHHRRKARATIALAEVENAHRYGSVEINTHGEIVCFLEKAQEGPGRINGGIYVLGSEILAVIPEGRAVSLEREIFPKLIGHGFFGFSSDAYFVDIGVPEDFLGLQASPSRLLTAGG